MAVPLDPLSDADSRLPRLLAYAARRPTGGKDGPTALDWRIIALLATSEG